MSKIYSIIFACIISGICYASSKLDVKNFITEFRAAIKSRDVKKIEAIAGTQQPLTDGQVDFFTGNLNVGEFNSRELTFNEFLATKPKIFISKWYQWFDWQQAPKKNTISYSIWFIKNEKVADFKNHGKNAQLEFMVDFMVCNIVIEEKKIKLDNSLCFSDAGSPGGLLD